MSYLLPRFSLIILLAPAVHALIIQGEVMNPEADNIYNRFDNISAGGNTINTSFIHNALDLTGVGFLPLVSDGGVDLGPTNTGRRAVTLVSPRHYLTAWHTRPVAGETIRFVDTAGNQVDRTVATVTPLRQAGTNSAGDPAELILDLAIGTITSPILPSDNISFHPVLNFATEAEYLLSANNTLIAYGRQAQAAMGTAAGFDELNAFATFNDNAPTSDDTVATRTIYFDFVVASATNGQCRYEGRDSGAPVLVDAGGIPAIVGTNSYFQTATDQFDNPVFYRMQSNFVGDPDYIDQLDEFMKPFGYNMTRKNLAASNLTVTLTPPVVARAGYPFTVDATLDNTSSNDAHNVTLDLTSSFVPVSSGTDWVVETSGTVAARRGQIAAGDDAILSSTFTVATPQIVNVPVAVDSDETSSSSTSINVTVIESYLSYTSALVDNTVDLDADGDSVLNLQEYAFGGNPSSNSLFFGATSIPLLPQVADGTAANTMTVTYIRRTDAAARALTYDIQTSTTPEGSSFENVTPTTAMMAPLAAGFELVTATVPATGDSRYFRVKISLNEG